ncbi:hypothetical protein B0T09DRAFT_79347 [Sordaria sp. MPI-SDFR-AT-0083]|nr:hypothetical protein B0T09DRAFT_79347 [Sordaria sp. MPI-SDFR-AT-0083]
MAGVSTLCSICLAYSAGHGVSGTVHSTAKAVEKRFQKRERRFQLSHPNPCQKKTAPIAPIDNLPLTGLSMGERTGSRVFQWVMVVCACCSPTYGL